MKLEDTIKKRIKTMRIIEGENLTEIKITAKEAKQLGGIKEIEGVKLVILNDISKTDCFAYHKKIGIPCYALDQLYCKNKKCNFYRKENDNINIANIEKDIIKYEEHNRYKDIKGASLR